MKTEKKKREIEERVERGEWSARKQCEQSFAVANSIGKIPWGFEGAEPGGDGRCRVKLLFFVGPIRTLVHLYD